MRLFNVRFCPSLAVWDGPAGIRSLFWILFGGLILSTLPASSPWNQRAAMPPICIAVDETLKLDSHAPDCATPPSLIRMIA